MARPSKLTAEVERAICDALKAGATRRMAAEYAGVGESTMRTWCAAKGARFRSFQAALKAAEAKGDVGALAVIRQAAQNGTWQAAAWLLERRHPAEYGRRQVVAVEPSRIDADALDAAARQGIGSADAAVLWQRQLEVAEAAYRAGHIDALAYMTRLDRLTAQAARLVELRLKVDPGNGGALPDVRLAFGADSPAIAADAVLPADVPPSRRIAGGDAIDVG